jgi:hypothetical protein
MKFCPQVTATAKRGTILIQLRTHSRVANRRPALPIVLTKINVCPWKECQRIYMQLLSKIKISLKSTVKSDSWFLAGRVAVSSIHKQCRSIQRFAKKFLFKSVRPSISKSKEKPRMLQAKAWKMRAMVERKSSHHQGKSPPLNRKGQFQNGNCKACS